MFFFNRFVDLKEFFEILATTDGDLCMFVMESKKKRLLLNIRKGFTLKFS